MEPSGTLDGADWPSCRCPTTPSAPSRCDSEASGPADPALAQRRWRTGGAAAPDATEPAGPGRGPQLPASAPAWPAAATRVRLQDSPPLGERSSGGPTGGPWCARHVSWRDRRSLRPARETTDRRVAARPGEATALDPPAPDLGSEVQADGVAELPPELAHLADALRPMVVVWPGGTGIDADEPG